MAWSNVSGVGTGVRTTFSFPATPLGEPSQLSRIPTGSTGEELPPL